MICRRLVVLAAALALVLSACHPATGSARCDLVLSSQVHRLETLGWRLDCTPSMTNWSDSQQRYVAAWVDRSSHTVWIWPNYGIMDDDRVLRKVAQHELGHVLYGSDEWTADAFSYCTLPQPGVSYQAPLPTAADCARFR